MATRTPSNRFVGLLALAGAACLVGGIGIARPVAASGGDASSVAVNYRITQPSQRLQMVVNSSRLVSLDKRIPRYQVHNEQVLRADPVSPTQINVSAIAPGVTQINLWDTDDNLYTIDVVVSGDAREVEGVLADQFPYSSLRVTPLPNGAVVSGNVTNVDDVDRAMAVVQQFYSSVVNNIQVSGVQRILLHTKVMEVSRTKFRDLGLDMGFLDGNTLLVTGVAGQFSPAASSMGGIIPNGNAATARFGIVSGHVFDSLINALRQNDLIKVLAEPIVVAEHGRPARFLSGERFPIAIPTGDGSVAIQFEEVGTIVDFVPFVLGNGRIRLEIRPEVSEINPTRNVSIAGTSVPGIRQRYVETAVEMQAGQTLALAGLLQTRTEAQTAAIPLLGELPYFGTFFRRVNEVQNDIELLVLVRPELVDAMEPCQVPSGGPGTNTTSPTDSELFFHGYIEVPKSPTAHGGSPPPGGEVMFEHPEGFLPEAVTMPPPQQAAP